MSTVTPTLTTYLIDLWRASELYAGDEIRPHESGTLFTAWDIDQQRVCMKFIVSEPISKAAFDDLSLDLAVLLHEEANKMRDEEIANGYAEGEAADLAIHYGPYYIDVFLPADGTRNLHRAELLGIYAPELFLHFVPNNLMIEGNAAGIYGGAQ
jgi:hypothetical protein